MYKKVFFILTLSILLIVLLPGCQSPAGWNGDASSVELLDTLTARATTAVKAPGWLHITEQIVYDIDKENAGVLSNGTALPLEQINDAWYHLDDRGQVFQYVNTMTTTDGRQIQVSVFNDNMIVNLTTNLVLPMNPYSLGALDYRFSEEIHDYIERTGDYPTVEEKEVDGRQAAAFTISEELDEPATSDNYADPVVALRSVGYYDTGSGLMFRLERYRIFEDGSERLYYSTDMTVELDARPSQDILDYMLGID